jgi:hypothetical protein
MTPGTLFNTLLTLLPTERMDAMAATAISEAINVYSIAVAPRWSFARRRKMDNIRFSPSPPAPGQEPTPVISTHRYSVRIVSQGESSGQLKLDQIVKKIL